MGVLLGMIIIFMILLVVLIGLSVGVAFLLHWLLPAVGLEMALLIAVIAVGQNILIFARLLNALPPPGPEEGDESDLPPIVILDREVAMPRRRRKRP
ncbi:hypothetical protein EKD04_015085 [Chloroflexales bacterium ZM16-3]|nr:hypothetical protein [Chloroflexales bacterium ZM16-3]